ncbi:hypothetical protein CFC21_094973 [Triticum aestivum]|uniref:DUF4220 domain-containing protein n=2 Tax=Triticum aestivum TaxID=4565 RepID=A0A9R1LPG3_WHEAT|nr:uncharacterized protein LOC123153298 [Triticum aestivum]XP_044428439.1 uncharacterized protein LOC123153331 [Triticum aestivum]XP_044428450.1 uncharacterized protein LOC123153359 [Triticum aestivum]XP_044428466.1 uncharacterized protein LOC123153382 [Triticum aestivum]KAF7092491.1 hypothetical protein CFC21_094968 [Triticum aestivum]KAF7092492.1 hypothetical protein CFC21_094969 [Triticum aestivum]KAF7092493.1 hypothetical protein CFC21_094970 [Triticum aestivum]KAF7092494.1 hypothetical 
MDQGDQQWDGMNITRALEALSPYINNPRETVIRIEVFVGVSTALLFLQVTLGPCRRRSSNFLIQGALWLAYTLSFPLSAYTIGQMLSSPVKNGLYPLWVALILWAVGCSNSMTAYGLDDNKLWRRYLFVLLQYFFYAGIIFRLLVPTRYEFLLFPKGPIFETQPIAWSIDILISVLLFTSLVRAMANWIATDSYHSQVVADYMRDQVNHTANHHVSVDPITMEGYRYIVFLPSHLLCGFKVAKGPTYRNKLVPADDGIITIDAIWREKFDDSWLNTDGGGSQLNDVCLSFALSHLLKRRFFGMECAEAAHDETRKFVLEGLLSHKDGGARAFRIIEVELGFLYDFFFTKYAALFHMERSFIAMVLLRIILLSITVAVLLGGSPTIMTPKPVIEVGTRSVDVSITIMIMGILLLVEALQIILYLMSDWATVSLACGYTRRSGTCNKLIPFVIWFLRRFNLSRYWTSMISNTKFGKFLYSLNLFGYWQNQMGQLSLFGLSKTETRPSRIFVWLDDLFCQAFLLANLTVQEYILQPIFSKISNIFFSSAKTSIGVPDLVKKEIVSCLQKTNIGGPLTNGQAALRCNGEAALQHHVVLEHISCTLENQSQTMTMLIWHIATEYCDLPSPNELEEHQSSAQEEENAQIDKKYKQVAIILSRYCIYLIANVPALLPGDSTDTLMVYRAVVNEVQRDGVWASHKPCKAELLNVINNCDSRRRTKEEGNNIIEGSPNNNNEEDTIFMKGLKLGKKLEEIGDGALRWKLMADFWVETIIYIAPSDDATAHMERLAQGGEFLTHVWALLTHAGIVRHDQRRNPEDLV